MAASTIGPPGPYSVQAGVLDRPTEKNAGTHYSSVIKRQLRCAAWLLHLTATVPGRLFWLLTRAASRIEDRLELIHWNQTLLSDPQD